MRAGDRLLGQARCRHIIKDALVRLREAIENLLKRLGAMPIPVDNLAFDATGPS